MCMMRGRRRVSAFLRTQVSEWTDVLTGVDVEGDVWRVPCRKIVAISTKKLWVVGGGRQGAITLLHTTRASFRGGGGYSSAPMYFHSPWSLSNHVGKQCFVPPLFVVCPLIFYNTMSTPSLPYNIFI